jgi:hypothetical protein
MKKKIIGLAFVLLSIMIVSVSAFVYELAQQTESQTIINVATITLKDSTLGNIDEGATNFYNSANMSNLGAAVSLTTTKAVYLHLASTLASETTYYTTYNIVVKIATKPTGGTHSVGETISTLTIASPNSAAINLDVGGAWTFDFELTTTAKSVTGDQARTVTITVTAEST